MPGTLSQALDNLYTTTWQNRRMDVADNIFDSRPFWYWLKEKGKLTSMEGGKWIEVNLRYGKSPNVAWIGKGEQVNMGDMEHLTIAYYEWRYLIDSIIRFMVDDQKNRGKQAILNLADSKVDTSQMSLTDELETTLFGAQSGLKMYGLRDLVADSPSTSKLVGHVNQGTYEWWRNQTHNLNNDSWAAEGHQRMRTMLNDCMNNDMNDRPDIIVSAQTPYEYYEDDTLEQRRVVNKTLGDAGFETQEYKGIPMIWSPKCSERMYFLNTNFLEFVYDPMLYFDMTEWKPIPNQANDRAAQIVTACQLITNRRRVHGVIHNINTA